LVEFPPAFHEAVGAALRIGAQLGFELEGADSDATGHLFRSFTGRLVR
jgi:hypothetical protein